MDKMRVEKINQYRKELGVIPSLVGAKSAEFDGHMFTVAEISARVIHRAASLYVDAGLGGHHHDGGSKELFRELQCWIDGLQGKIPSGRAFQDIVKHMVQEENPEEFAEYKRLHAKYGDKNV